MEVAGHETPVLRVGWLAANDCAAYRGRTSSARKVRARVQEFGGNRSRRRRVRGRTADHNAAGRHTVSRGSVPPFKSAGAELSAPDRKTRGLHEVRPHNRMD